MAIIRSIGCVLYRGVLLSRISSNYPPNIEPQSLIYMSKVILYILGGGLSKKITIVLGFLTEYDDFLTSCVRSIVMCFFSY